MRLKNILIVVKNIETSLKFYTDLFDLPVLLHRDGNVMLMGGLVLQEEYVWKQYVTDDVLHGRNAAELYFEERDIDSFIQKLEASEYQIEYLTPLTIQPGGKKIIRFYDPDRNLIEVGSPSLSSSLETLM